MTGAPGLMALMFLLFVIPHSIMQCSWVSIWGWEWCTVGPRGSQTGVETGAQFVHSCMELWVLPGLSGAHFVHFARKPEFYPGTLRAVWNLWLLSGLILVCANKQNYRRHRENIVVGL